MRNLGHYQKLKSHRLAASKVRERLKGKPKFGKPKFPYTFYYTGYQDYRHDMLNIGVGKATQCAVLEYFIHVGGSYLMKGFMTFFHSNSQLEKRLGFSSTTIRKVIDELENKKIIKRIKKSRTDKNYFEVNFLFLKVHYKELLTAESLEDKEGYDRFKDRIRLCTYMHEFKKMLLEETMNTKVTKPFIDDEDDPFDDDEDDDDDTPPPPKKKAPIAKPAPAKRKALVVEDEYDDDEEEEDDDDDFDLFE